VTVIFFLIVAMITVQDISVDGWACSLLSPEYVGMTANLQLTGQLIGISSYNAYFEYLDETIGYSAFLRYVSVILILSTVAVLIFVKETSPAKENSWAFVKTSYVNIFKLLKLKPMMLLGKNEKNVKIYVHDKFFIRKSDFLPDLQDRLSTGWGSFRAKNACSLCGKENFRPCQLHNEVF